MSSGRQGGTPVVRADYGSNSSDPAQSSGSGGREARVTPGLHFDKCNHSFAPGAAENESRSSMKDEGGKIARGGSDDLST